MNCASIISTEREYKITSWNTKSSVTHHNECYLPSFGGSQTHSVCPSLFPTKLNIMPSCSKGLLSACVLSLQASTLPSSSSHTALQKHLGQRNISLCEMLVLCSCFFDDIFESIGSWILLLYLEWYIKLQRLRQVSCNWRCMNGHGSQTDNSYLS